MESPAIQVSGFTKSYGDIVAVDNISFTVLPGEIFGLLGPNGAGKTTTLESLEGLRTPDAGRLRIMGVDPTRSAASLRNTLGVQLQASSYPDTMRVDEAMRFFSAYHGVKPRYDLIDRMGLAEKRRAQYHELSTGQKRRLALALAVAHDPPVVVLDEPTAGLDVPSRVELHRLLRELQANGTTILLATHDMAEAEAMADRVAILLAGRIAATGSPLELTATGAGLTKISVRTERVSLSAPSLSFPAVRQTFVKGDYHIYFTGHIAPTVTAIIQHIDSQGDAIIDLRVERPSLEDRFLEITRETVGTRTTAAGGARA
jgi:ABC-2 type transport system ATP-binding protein